MSGNGGGLAAAICGEALLVDTKPESLLIEGSIMRRDRTCDDDRLYGITAFGNEVMGSTIVWGDDVRVLDALEERRTD